MSLLLFCGAGRGVRTSALIIQLLTLLSQPERQRDAAAKRPTVLFIKALSSLRPATDVLHHAASPASQPAEEKVEMEPDV